MDGSENRTSSADDQARRAAKGLQEFAIAALRAEVSGQDCHRSGTVLECCRHLRDIPGIRNHDEHASRGLAEDGPSDRGDIDGPGMCGGCRPHPADSGNGAVEGPAVEDAAALVPRPCRLVFGASENRCCIEGMLRCLGPRMTRRDGRAKHVPECPCVAIGDHRNELRNLAGEDRLRRQHPLERAERGVD